jgi:hypothetical protein
LIQALARAITDHLLAEKRSAGADEKLLMPMKESEGRLPKTKVSELDGSFKTEYGVLTDGRESQRG